MAVNDSKVAGLLLFPDMYISRFMSVLKSHLYQFRLSRITSAAAKLKIMKLEIHPVTKRTEKLRGLSPIASAGNP